VASNSMATLRAARFPSAVVICSPSLPHQSRLSAECSLADDHRLAADLDLFENSSTASERNVKTTRAAHADALEAHEPRLSLGWYSVVLEQVCAQRSSRAAGAGILRNAEAGREHSTVHRGAIIGRLGREQENRVLFEVHRAE